MKLWTIQPEEIGKLLENGESFICNVNKSQFYNENCFHDAYDWMISKMNEKNISNPKHIKLPIWAWYRRNNKCKKPDLRESGFAKRGDKCVLIELEIPLIEKRYDLFIPINKKVGTVKNLIENALVELTDSAYVPKDDSNFYSKETGEIFDVNKTVRDTNLRNGSRIILI